MFDWNEIETVLLDMDGTLLDRYFDDQLWQQQLPLQWGEQNGLDIQSAKARLIPIFQDTQATLDWYSLDYWSARLGIDVFELGAGIEHLIQLRPYVEEFLQFLQASGKNIVLVTNSHEKLIVLKMQHTGIEGYFQHIFNAHSFGKPKEEAGFWEILGEHIDYQLQSTVLVDDNLAVLRSARHYGIAHQLAIAQPNSQLPPGDTEEFIAVKSFRDLCVEDKQ